MNNISRLMAGLTLSATLLTTPVDVRADENNEENRQTRVSSTSGPYNDLPWLNRFSAPVKTLQNALKAMEDCLGPWAKVFGLADDATAKED